MYLDHVRKGGLPLFEEPITQPQNRQTADPSIDDWDQFNRLIPEQCAPGKVDRVEHRIPLQHHPQAGDLLDQFNRKENRAGVQHHLRNERRDLRDIAKKNSECR